MTTSGVSTHREALSALRRAWEVVEPRMRTSLDEFCPAFRTVVGYHLGWCDAAGEPVSAGGGKAVRPALALSAAQALGAAEQAAADAAVAVELVHNFSLVHDDVMDGDERRRHRGTVWSVFGIPTAILAGDVMLMAAQQVLLSGGHPVATRALAVLGDTVQQMLYGQMLDISFESRQDVASDDVLIMTEGKTASLIRCACTLGAMYGDGGPDEVAALGDFGRHLGMAFQYVDDLLGIWGRPDRTGKPVWSDLRARKKSLPVVAALSGGTAAGRELARLYGSPAALSDDQLVAVAELVDEAGGRSWARARADRHLQEALSCLEAVDADPRAVRVLVAISRLITDRDG
ncbi:polyprenyl synthetase family protein [Saccharothrix australiensis]|uniref:Geranylgeranyl diphosphate synthase type I n=1 Tax=Saccharothrix australiensis TaxID=2072 RepID=A0A495VYX0_9PSEU|nr:polyprenyl synthetase family protein [Saccharothrix australiensis]RKT54449.1 geranylgeranyl diphosphate synthase type I [Saccharothrix australiensis]